MFSVDIAVNLCDVPESLGAPQAPSTPESAGGPEPQAVSQWRVALEVDGEELSVCVLG